MPVVPSSRPHQPRSGGGVGPGFAAMAFVALSFAAPVASGQTAPPQTISGFALSRFEPAGADSPWMTLESLGFAGHLRPSFAATGDWAWRPLVFYDPSGSQLGALVNQQGMVHADAAVTLWNRARVDLALPIAVIDSGGDVLIRDQRYAGPSGGGVGDLRLGADVRFLGGPRDAWRVGGGAQLFLPTGGTRNFTSDGGVRFWPRLMAAGERGRLVWAGRLGVHLRPREAHGLAPGSELTWGASAGWWLQPRLLLGAELYGSKTLSSGGPFSQAAAPLEILLGGHFAITPQWRVRLGAGPGLTDGPGTPAMRIVLGVAYELPSPRTPSPPSPLP